MYYGLVSLGKKEDLIQNFVSWFLWLPVLRELNYLVHDYVLHTLKRKKKEDLIQNFVSWFHWLPVLSELNYLVHDYMLLFYLHFKE